MSKQAAIDPNRPAKLTVLNTLGYIYKQNGIKGLYRGVTPRIGLGIWQTICMVSFADYVKVWYVVSALFLFLSVVFLTNPLTGLNESDNLRFKSRADDI